MLVRVKIPDSEGYVGVLLGYQLQGFFSILGYFQELELLVTCNSILSYFSSSRQITAEQLLLNTKSCKTSICCHLEKAKN